MKKSSFVRSAVAILALGTGLASSFPAWADEQYFPLQTYRVGPYAAGGTGGAGGYIDYLTLINERDGGVNGVKLTWSECETGYIVEKGIECYERLKNHQPPPTAWNPMSVGIAYAMLERVAKDKVPMLTINHGRTDTTDGAVFPYVFPLQLNPWSETSAIINYIGQRLGGADKLKGAKIAVLYHGSPYGKETIPIFALLAKKFGFSVTEIEVPDPGSEQQSQWLQIQRLKPDFVVLRGWGVMNPVALRTAVQTGYPVDHVIGNVWSNSEEDVRPAGDAAKGYIAVTTHPAGDQFPVLKEIRDIVYKNGKGNLQDQSRIGSVYHNLGIINGILTVEAIRTGQAKFGHRSLTGEEMQWALEHLKLDDARIAQLGATGLIQPITLSCADHEGGGAVRFQQWDGTKWTPITDWIHADRALLRPLIEKSANRYARAHNITPRDCKALDQPS
ncbi:Leucine-, isoleucine-, valine-, threonine-, and alanine-binding protein [Granulibacter bethesdensis]|uniref:Leucine-, isoleucine-, valine-, threonine-, and alanine-binding protein n=1 Tax=Granulibacter bethesdensis TaxID=364410 RepID=A0AAC9P8Q8_9PROT|nr:ABC transporter substrate-binding protein [Granulibacter bethesdensis]APH54786.1 Leucine-, isoleucine-, valine-, threonine-, and alanine-binding protein [Granulibacter bethesdensis]APH62372.1 Leucine-, isoleucine-, valine-, threonine-, and alanine-binding protein [Granulibacter bethesdensis]